MRTLLFLLFGLIVFAFALHGLHADEQAVVQGTLEVLTVNAAQGIQTTVEVRPLAKGGLRLPAGDDALHRTSTGDDGRASFAPLGPGLYEVRAYVAGTPATFGYATIPQGGGHVRLRLSCGAGTHVLAGRAIWRDGRPFRGWARIERPEFFWGAFSSSIGRMYTKTDAEGHFEFPGLPRAKYKLGCTTEDGTFDAQDEPEIQLPLSSGFVYVVDERGATQTGTVVEETSGTPIPDADLRALSLGMWQPAKTRSDRAGSFTMTLPDAIWPELLVEAPGFAPRSIPLSPLGGSLRIQMTEPGRIKGRVATVQGGKPATGARVYAIWRGDEAPEALWRTATAGADGRYSIEEAVPGPNEIFVIGNGWATAGTSPWDERPSKATHIQVRAGKTLVHDLQVVRSASARIEVTYSDGKPALACGAAIEPTIRSVYPDSFWKLPFGDVNTMREVDGKGYMVFQNLIPGVAYEGRLAVLEHDLDFRIPATRSGETAVIKQRVPLRVPVAFGTREVVPPCRISGVIAGPAMLEQHLVELMVKGIHSDGSSDGNASHVTTHAPCGSGFEIEGLEAKRYLLTARARWRGIDYEASTTVSAGRSARTLKLELRVGAKKINRLVRVVDSLGRPIPRAGCWLHWSGLADNDSGTSERVHGGMLRISPPPSSGTHVWINITDPRSSMGERVEAGSSILGPLPIAEVPDPIRLPAPHTLAGTVVGPNGEGLPGVNVLVLPLRPKAERLPAHGGPGRIIGGVHGSATTGANGRFEVLGLGSGPYQLSADPPPEFAWPDLVGPVAVGSKDLRLRLHLALTKRVRIVDGLGKPLPGAVLRIDWRDTDGRWCRFRRYEEWGYPWTTASPMGIPKRWTADDEGYVELSALHPKRTYLLSIEPPGDRPDVNRLWSRLWRASEDKIVLPTRR